MGIFQVDGADGDGIDRIRVAVKVAVVVVIPAIPRSKDKHRSFPISSLHHPFLDGVFDYFGRAIHGLAIVGWAPRARIDVVDVVPKVDGMGLGIVCDRQRKDSDSFGNYSPATG